MRSIDMQTWSRLNHFKFYSTVNHPHFNMCVNVDVTAFHPFVKRRGVFRVCQEGGTEYCGYESTSRSGRQTGEG
jgi:hypothetical protein